MFRIPAAVLLLIDTDDVMALEPHLLVFILAHLNSAINPIFNILFNSKIKKNVKRFLNFGRVGPFIDSNRYNESSSLKA